MGGRETKKVTRNQGQYRKKNHNEWVSRLILGKRSFTGFHEKISSLETETNYNFEKRFDHGAISGFTVYFRICRKIIVLYMETRLLNRVKNKII